VSGSSFTLSSNFFQNLPVDRENSFAKDGLHPSESVSCLDLVRWRALRHPNRQNVHESIDLALTEREGIEATSLLSGSVSASHAGQEKTSENAVRALCNDPDREPSVTPIDPNQVHASAKESEALNSCFENCLQRRYDLHVGF
jgi:hypothetical protein